MIVKPLYGNGGAGVFHLKPGDTNLGSLVELFASLPQRALDGAALRPGDPPGRQADHPDRRQAGGALNRVPAAEETRANLHVGGRAEKAILTRRDHEICEMIGPTLQERGLIFVGIDVIGDWLTEINVTSPTGLQEIDRFDERQSGRPDLGRDRGQDQPAPAARAADLSAGYRQDRTDCSAARCRLRLAGPVLMIIPVRGAG